MSLVLALSLALAAPTPPKPTPQKPPPTTHMPAITLPPSLNKTLSTSKPTFAATLTVVVTNVPKPPAQKVAPAKDLVVGERLYKQRCVLCHGDAGAADGVGARRIQPEPQHLNDVIWQANVTDDEIARAVLEGGAAVSKSPMMPANPDLKSKPADVGSLVAYVRTLRAKHGSVLGSVVLPDKSSRAVHAVADDKGTATLVIPELPKGPVVVTVLVDGEGTVGCTLSVDVDKDATLQCPVPPK